MSEWGFWLLPLLQMFMEHAVTRTSTNQKPVDTLDTKKTFVKVLGVVLLPASAHIWTKQRKARRGPGNRVRANLSLHFCRQFVYPWFVYWFVILQGIKTEGVRGCNTHHVDHRILWGWAWVIKVFSLQTVCLPSCCLRVWEAAIHVLLITGHCEGELELSWSSHFHRRQSVYPHVVYSVHQLATTQVMFTTRCSLIPRLSPHGNQGRNEQEDYLIPT